MDSGHDGVDAATGVPTTACPLLDDLVRTSENRLRNREPESLCRLEVDPELERRRLFDRNVGGLRAAEDAIHEDGRALEEAGEAGSVRD